MSGLTTVMVPLVGSRLTRLLETACGQQEGKDGGPVDASQSMAVPRGAFSLTLYPKRLLMAEAAFGSRQSCYIIHFVYRIRQ